jgi:hypothetical protein
MTLTAVPMRTRRVICDTAQASAKGEALIPYSPSTSGHIRHRGEVVLGEPHRVEAQLVGQRRI